MQYYLIGIKGTGMSALAGILKDLNHEVYGYDDDVALKFTEGSLIQKDIKIYYDNSFILTPNTIVIRTTAISDEHSEVLRVKERGLKVYDYHEFLGELTKKYKTIAVCGCHGKTTTTSMLSAVLKESGCNYLIGDGSGSANPLNELFVIEACEHYRHFLAYSPAITIIINIDLDHVGYYKDIDDIKDAYTEFANQTKDLVVMYGDNLDKITVKKPTLYYGFNDDNDFIARNVTYHEKGLSFDVYHKNDFYIHLDLALFGQHMILNSLAVIAVSNYLNISKENIIQNLSEFRGAKRRFQEKKYKNNIIIDDYAHHPVEIKATLGAAKQKYPDKKIIAAFQPYHYDRTSFFAYEMAEALNMADVAYVFDIKSSDPPSKYPGITNELIIKHLNNGSALRHDENIVDNEKDSVIIFMSPSEIKMCKDIVNQEEDVNKLVKRK